MIHVIVAIDGFSGTGKSSTAKEVAKKLSYGYVDTGAMYRSVTLYLLNNNVNYHDKQQLNKALEHINLNFSFNNEKRKSEIYLNNVNVEDAIRSPHISESVSLVASIPEVRRKMVMQQQEMGKHKKLVMDGRDIGTVVFPNAEVKIFMVADVKVRAKRRQDELKNSGIASTIEEVINNLEQRDLLDSTRSDSPLRKAEDAIEIDTTHMTFEEQVNKIVDLTKKYIHEN